MSQTDEDICMNIIIDLYFLERYISDDMDPDVLNKGLEELVNQLENQRYNRNHSLLNCRFTDQQLRDFVYSNPDGVNVQRLNEEECKIYKSALEKFYKMEEIEAIEIMGYACYGYDRPIFQCDWEKSRDSMLKLIKRADDETKASAANTLGYIYYYGRCNNYEPQYEEAFKYFSIAAFFGIYEAIYKVGDMMLHGKGIPKNETAALNLYHNIYEEIFDDFQRQNYKNNLADIALRLAGACKKKEKYLSAFYYYLIANLAIEMRMRETKFFGDRKVFDSIENGLEEVRLQLYSNGLDVRNRYDMVYIESVLSQIFYYKDDKCLVKLDVKIYDDEIRLRFGRVEVENSLYPMKLVVCVPEIAYRDLTDRVYLSVDKEDVFIYDAFEKNNGIINRYEVYRGGIN